MGNKDIQIGVRVTQELFDRVEALRVIQRRPTISNTITVLVEERMEELERIAAGGTQVDPAALRATAGDKG